MPESPILRKLRSPGGAPSGCAGNVSVHDVCFILLIVGLLIAILIAGIGNLRARARMAKCVGNLKQISVLMNVYKTTYLRHPESLPDDFRPLAELTSDYGVFVCPGSDDDVRSVADLRGKTSYRYFCSLSLLTRLAAVRLSGKPGYASSDISTDFNKGALAETPPPRGREPGGRGHRRGH